MTPDMTADPPIFPSAPDASINPTTSLQYWNSVSADTNGMLGGYPQTSRIDLQGSSNFLTKLRRKRYASPSTNKPTSALPLLPRVADCGAGIGRVTKGLLLPIAERVDIVEPVEKFTDELVREMEGMNDDGGSRAKIRSVINKGLQDWTPETGSYNLIWNQWCLGHLTDTQLVEYLRRCGDGLVDTEVEEEEEQAEAREAYIIVKENISTDIWGKDIFDEEDSSVTRSDEKFRSLFKEAGLRVVAMEVQKGFPKELFPVRMYALRPE